MILLSNLTTLSLPLLYLVLGGRYLWVFTAERSSTRNWTGLLLWGTIAVHFVHSCLHAFKLGRLPLASPLEFFSLLALTTMGVYAVLERVIKNRQTGVFVVGLCFLLQFWASAFITPRRPTVNPLLNDPGYATHVLLMLLAYAAMNLSFLYAILYHVQARELNRRNFGLIFRRLPPLQTLENMSVGAVRFAIPLLFMALASGQLRMYSLRHKLPEIDATLLSPWDPKILASWVIFLGYAMGLLGHARWGWRGKRMNRVAIVCWVLVIVTMGLIHHFVPSFHDFGLRGGAS